MNGTLLCRWSASIVLASFFLTLSACGVELSGLFDGDGGTDAAVPRDVGLDASPPTDQGSDVRADAGTDDRSVDGGSTDVSIDDRGGGDPAIDPGLDIGDAAIDASLDGDGRSDAVVDGDVTRDTSLDGDGTMDAVGDPLQDATAEDTAAEPPLDAPIETAIDAADAPADASSDGADAEPPGTCFAPCNTFADIGQTITRTVDQGPTPTMTGGTLVDGTYVATSMVQYNGDNSQFSLSETSVIAGNIDTWVSSTNGQAEVRYTTTITTNNNQLTFAFCCPGGGNLTIFYTTDGMTISNVDPANPNRIITYTRQ